MYLVNPICKVLANVMIMLYVYSAELKILYIDNGKVNYIKN